jgi:hypothetical protein
MLQIENIRKWVAFEEDSGFDSYDSPGDLVADAKEKFSKRQMGDTLW